MKKSIGVLLLLALAGCATPKSYNICTSNLDAKTDLSSLVLDLDLVEDLIYIVDPQPNPGDGPTFQYINHMTVPQGANTDVASGVGTAANLITQVVLTEHHKAKLQKTANQKADPIREAFSKERIMELLESDISNGFSGQKTFCILDPNGASAVPLTAPILKVKPDFRFSFDLTRLQLKLNVAITLPESDESIYQNSFEYWSPLVGVEGTEENRIALWSAEDGRRIAARLAEGGREVVAMFVQDLAAARAQPGQVPPKYKTHRIYNDQGHYLLRGYPIKVTDGRVWIKDLRGNIRSLQGSLDTPQGG